MKKSIFLLNDLLRISRGELRKIAGGSTRECFGCVSEYLIGAFGQRCGFLAPSGEICRGTVRDGQCCVSH
ncbi:hypothetical protein [Ascidiimonas aurantiaca]|uniref:hypothetical protein n=1 Tax=Ascidiimonas aurantiaca TaxID=1685432 RepID=UPI0030EE3747